jgi:multidrug efflux pump subunit AcrA (membrane-fusion protein)
MTKMAGSISPVTASLAQTWKRLGLCRFLLLLLLASPALTVPGWCRDQEPAAAGPGVEFQFTGKLFCSLKRSVVLPYPGELTALSAAPGQAVAAGAVLGRYRLTPEARHGLSRRLAPPQIGELEAKLAQLDKDLAALRAQHRSTQALAQENLASRQSLTQVEGELQALSRSREAVARSLAQERRLVQDDRQVLARQLGISLPASRLPEEALLLAPITGHVIWTHPDLKVGAELKAGEPVIQVGVMDPMILSARVHEREAMHLAPDTEARVVVESLPGRIFAARLARLPWASQVPALEQPSYFEAEFHLANPDLLLKDGLKATLTVKKATR